jgi:Protein of unknown function with HXXEE motif
VTRAGIARAVARTGREAGGGFRRQLWIFPAAFAAHVVEEAPGFVAWAAELGAPMTLGGFLRNHVGYSAALLALVAWVHVRPTRMAVFCLMSWTAAQQLWNAVFHVHATVALGAYGPGVITAVAIYLPTYLYMAGLALRDGLLAPRDLAVTVAVGAVGFAAAMKLLLFGGGAIPPALVPFAS